MLGFELTIWDYATFATAFLAGGSVLGFLVWLAGLPGRIAIARNHPEAEAVSLMGYAGLLPTIYPWVQAFIWAYKPTDVVDIRRFPQAEARAIEDEIGHLKGDPAPQSVAKKKAQANAASAEAKPTKPAQPGAKPPTDQPGN